MKVLIGIQARSGSSRLPRKAFEPIAGKMLLDHVIDACKSAAAIIERKDRVDVTVAVLTPEGDPIAIEFSNRVSVVQGSHYDVLGRYRLAVETHEPDYLVRITGDCPMIPPFIIGNLTHMTLKHGYDYMSNVDENCRTSMDGHDCEVISTRLFLEMEARATDKRDREHVTTWVRRERPVWAKMAVAVNNHDLSHLKVSVDTQEDLAAVRQAFDTSSAKLEAANRHYRKGSVHRL